MIKKENRLIITFHTTTEAIKMEKICKEQGADGRIIPVPVSITAGCGLAWCAGPESREKLQDIIEKNQIHFQEIQECIV